LLIGGAVVITLAIWVVLPLSAVAASGLIVFGGSTALFGIGDLIDSIPDFVTSGKLEDIKKQLQLVSDHLSKLVEVESKIVQDYRQMELLLTEADINLLSEVHTQLSELDTLCINRNYRSRKSCTLLHCLHFKKGAQYLSPENILAATISNSISKAPVPLL